MTIRPFISYASEDRDVAVLLHAELTAVGAAPWLDIVNLLGGEDWELAIEQALADATHVIVLISQQSVNKRGYVQKEIRRALSLLEEWPPGTTFIIPVRLDDSNARHRLLLRLHRIDLFDDFGAGVRRLIAALGIGGSRASGSRDAIYELLRGYPDIPSTVLATIVSRAQQFGSDLGPRGAYVRYEIKAWRAVENFVAADLSADVQAQITSNLVTSWPNSMRERQFMLAREILGWKVLRGRMIIPELSDSTRFAAPHRVHGRTASRVILFRRGRTAEWEDDSDDQIDPTPMNRTFAHSARRAERAP